MSSEVLDMFTTLLLADVPLAFAGADELELRLTHDQRRRARLRVTLPDGRVVGLDLPRGLCLKDGDRLRSEATGRVARIRASAEHVSLARTDDTWLLARAAYHLGNRHVALAIQPDRLLYLHDHVLDGMCRELGLTVEQRLAPFEPESGGYGHGHSHASVRGFAGHAHER